MTPYDLALIKGLMKLGGMRVLAFVLLLCSGVAAGADDFPYLEITIDHAQGRFAEGSLTSVQLTKAYLARIEALNRRGPKLGAVIETNPDAVAIATKLDAERKQGRVRGPLHGIPVLVKDNIATADRMETTAGSLALVGSKPGSDAAVITRLRDAGAVILGKTNLSEWANFRGHKSNSGWSGRGGFTRNPYVLDRNPSGSSSGSAVAVAANLCVVAIGTETDGSIISPSSLCGIVGIKPTVGLVSRTGIIPISVTQDTAGPMTRTVRDSAIVLAAIAGDDARDAATARIPAGAIDSVAQAGAGHATLKGVRLGLLKSGDLRPALQAVYTAAVARLRDAGAELVENLEIKTRAQIGVQEIVVLEYEFKDGVNAYLASLGPSAKVKTLAEVIAFNNAHAAEELQYFGQETLIKSNARGPLTDKAYLDAKAASQRLSRDEGIDPLLRDHQLDAIVALGSGPAGYIDSVTGDYSAGGTPTAAAPAGYPTLTLPIGQVRGLPVGMTVTGPAWSDARVLEIAAGIEAAVKGRRVPGFLETVEVE